MPYNPSNNNRLRVVAIVWIIIISLNALAAGFSFMVTPSGRDIGVPLSYLQYSPFTNFFIPGLLLFTFIGVWGVATAVLAIKKWNKYPLLIVMQGCLLLGWIVIQMLLVRDVNALHIVCGISALAWIVIGAVLQKEAQIRSEKAES